ERPRHCRRLRSITVTDQAFSRGFVILNFPSYFSFSLSSERMEPPGVRDIDGKPRRRNGAFGKSDIEGKAAKGSGERAGKRTSFKWAGAHESMRERARFHRALSSILRSSRAVEVNIAICGRSCSSAALWIQIAISPARSK